MKFEKLLGTLLIPEEEASEWEALSPCPIACIKGHAV